MNKSQNHEGFWGRYTCIPNSFRPLLLVISWWEILISIFKSELPEVVFFQIRWSSMWSKCMINWLICCKRVGEEIYKSIAICHWDLTIINRGLEVCMDMLWNIEQLSQRHSTPTMKQNLYSFTIMKQPDNVINDVLKIMIWGHSRWMRVCDNQWNFFLSWLEFRGN